MFIFCVNKSKGLDVNLENGNLENGNLGLNTGGPCYMRTFYLRFHVYAIEIVAFLRNISSYLPMLLVSLYVNLLYANHFLGPYLSHITRSACTVCFTVLRTHT